MFLKDLLALQQEPHGFFKIILIYCKTAKVEFTQTNADLIVEKFEGSYSNVVGLPLELLKSWLSKLGLAEEGVQ